VKTVATRLALLISRRRSLLTVVSVGAALVSAKAGFSFHLAGFWDGPH
jgi:hypothetical protein